MTVLTHWIFTKTDQFLHTSQVLWKLVFFIVTVEKLNSTPHKCIFPPWRWLMSSHRTRKFSTHRDLVKTDEWQCLKCPILYQWKSWHFCNRKRTIQFLINKWNLVQIFALSTWILVAIYCFCLPANLLLVPLLKVSVSYCFTFSSQIHFLTKRWALP